MTMWSHQLDIGLKLGSTEARLAPDKVKAENCASHDKTNMTRFYRQTFGPSKVYVPQVSPKTQ